MVLSLSLSFPLILLIEMEYYFLFCFVSFILKKTRCFSTPPPLVEKEKKQSFVEQDKER